MSSDFDLEALLSPLEGDAPSGPNLEYDSAFIAMNEAGRARAEQEYGATLIEGEGPDWSTVQQHALALLERSRDLRPAVWLARCSARRGGLAGAVQGLALVHGLLDRFWETLHPQLDADDGNDPTERLNALAPLVHYAEFMADLRAAALTSGRGAVLRVRDVELALGHAKPTEDESPPTEAGVREALRDAIAAAPALSDTLRRGWETARAIVALIDERAGGAQCPDLAPLVQLLRVLAKAAPEDAIGATDAAAAQPGAAEDHGVGNAPAPAEARLPRAAAAPPGAIGSRQDVIDALGRVCTWIETNEPSHPAPLLIRRAQRLMSKSFIEIIQDLTPEAEAEVRRLAGVTGD